MPKPGKRQKTSKLTSHRCRLRLVKPSFRCNFRHFPLVYKAKSNVLQKPFPRSQRQNQPLYRLIWHRNEPFEQDYWDYLSLYVCSWWDWDAYTIPLLCLRFRSVILPFQIRFKSLPKNGRKMGFGRDLQGRYIGLAWGFKIPYKRIFVACFFTKNYRRWPENLILKIYFWKFYWTLA